MKYSLHNFHKPYEHLQPDWDIMIKLFNLYNASMTTGSLTKTVLIKAEIICSLHPFSSQLILHPSIYFFISKTLRHVLKTYLEVHSQQMQ